MTVPGVQVENILSVTATDDGEHVIAVFGLKDGKEETLAVPISLFQGLIASFIAAGSDAYRQQLKRLGSDEAMLDLYGVCGITPTGFRMYRGRDPSTSEDLVLLRLITNSRRTAWLPPSETGRNRPTRGGGERTTPYNLSTASLTRSSCLRRVSLVATRLLVVLVSVGGHL